MPRPTAAEKKITDLIARFRREVAEQKQALALHDATGLALSTKLTSSEHFLSLLCARPDLVPEGAPIPDAPKPTRKKRALKELIGGDDELVDLRAKVNSEAGRLFALGFNVESDLKLNGGLELLGEHGLKTWSLVDCRSALSLMKKMKG